MMKISVKVKPRAKREAVLKTGEREFTVSVKAAPDGGKANEAVGAALAGFLGVARSRVKIIRGQKSRLKILEVL